MRTLALIALTTLAACAPDAAPRPAYRFFRDGREVWPTVLPVVGRPGEPAAGDLAALRHWGRWITLEEPGEYRFREPGSVYGYLARDGGPERCVWYATGYGWAPPSTMPDLLALRLRSPGPDELAHLGRLDPTRTTVAVHAGYLADDAVRNALPSGLQRLVLRASPIDSFDLRRLASLRRLKALIAPGIRLEDSSAIPTWPDLRCLVLTGAVGLTDLTFVEGLPRLAHLDVVGAGVSPEAVAALAAERPGLEIVHQWSRPLRKVTAGCDRLEVKVGSQMDDDLPKEARLLFALDGREAVQGFLDPLEFEDRSRGGEYCSCYPALSFSFYREGNFVTSLGLIHGSALRWGSVWPWPGDGILTRDSALALAHRLARRGVKGPLYELTRKSD